MNAEDTKLVVETLATVSRGLVGHHEEVTAAARDRYGAEAVERHGVRVIVIAFTDTPIGRVHSMSSDCHDLEALLRVLLVSRAELIREGVPS